MSSPKSGTVTIPNGSTVSPLTLETDPTMTIIVTPRGNINAWVSFDENLHYWKIHIGDSTGSVVDYIII